MATRASSSLLQHLKDTVAVVVEPWSGVTTQRMFGCDVWLVHGSLFALLMGYGRVVARLPLSSSALLAIDGAAPWEYGKKKSPTHWIMVPEDFHDDVDLLRDWLRRAYSEVRAMPAKKTPAKRAAVKKTPAEKTATKQTPAKKTPAKKTAAKKTPVKKTATKKTPAKKTAAKKTAPKKTAPKKTAPRSR